MSFNAVPTVATGDAWSAAEHNTYIKDNFAAIFVGTTAGDLDYYTSSSAKARLAKVLGGILYGGASAPAYTAGGLKGAVLYNSANNTPAWSGQGAAGTVLYNSVANTPIWVAASTIIPAGILHAKAIVEYDALAQSITGTTFVDVTNATVNIVTSRTCTIIMHASGVFWSPDNIAAVRAVIGGTAQAGGYPRTNDSFVTPFGFAHYRTGVAAGTITCKLQGQALTGAGDHAVFGIGNIVVEAFSE